MDFSTFEISQQDSIAFLSIFESISVLITDKNLSNSKASGDPLRISLIIWSYNLNI